MRSSPRPATFFQRAKASSSSVNTVALSRSLGRPESLVRSSQQYATASGLEVVAEGEVAEHLEERVVARGAADILEIVVLAARADTLLGGGRPDVLAALLAEEHALELHHAGIGEERASGPDAGTREEERTTVWPLFVEVVEKAVAEIVACHHGESTLYAAVLVGPVGTAPPSSAPSSA